MFEYDICVCGNSDQCPYRKECRRAEKRVGIYTCSNFYNAENDECEYFLEKEGDKNA